MPFTLAHPAAILPIARKWPRLPLSALVIGSMAPDFPYFLLIDNDYYHFGHSVRGVFIFCIPASIIALFVFHTIVKRPLLSLLPPRHVARLLPVANAFRLRSFGDALLNVVAVLIGAFSHIIVDSFTHVSGWSVRHLPVLAHPLPIYKALQYGGSVGGLWILYRVYGNWLVSAHSEVIAAQRLQRLLRPAHVLMFLGMLLILSIAAGTAFSYMIYERLGGSEPAKKVFADGLESGMSAYAFGLLLFSLLWQFLARKTSKANT